LVQHPLVEEVVATRGVMVVTTSILTSLVPVRVGHANISMAHLTLPVPQRPIPPIVQLKLLYLSHTMVHRKLLRYPELYVDCNLVVWLALTISLVNCMLEGSTCQSLNSGGSSNRHDWLLAVAGKLSTLFQHPFSTLTGQLPPVWCVAILFAVFTIKAIPQYMTITKYSLQ
jgi:hypothetical protein